MHLAWWYTLDHPCQAVPDEVIDNLMGQVDEPSAGKDVACKDMLNRCVKSRTGCCRLRCRYVSIHITYFAGKDTSFQPEDPELIEMGWGKAPVKVKEEEQAPAATAKKAVPPTPTEAGYNHRKASMALLRLRRNQNRMAALPEALRNLIETDDEGARRLLKDHGGNVDHLIESAAHMVFKENTEVDTETTTPLTEFQVGGR